MKVKIAIAQIKTITGDLEGNTERIIRDIENAVIEGVNIVVFPETAITGYCCGALFDHPHFIDYNIEFLEKNIVPKVPKNLVVIVGFVDKYGTQRSGRPDIRNSVAVIQNKKIVSTYDKILLANGSHHEDRKYFCPGDNAKVIEIQIGEEKLKIGTPICEDAWYKDHNFDVIRSMVSNGADLILCPNQSYYYYGKQFVREELFAGHAHRNKVPVVAVNAVGIGDIVKNIMIYDGGSMAFDSNGKKIVQVERFKEVFSTFFVETEYVEPKEPIVPFVYEKSKFTVKQKCVEIFRALVFEQKEMFNLLGIKKAQVHMSGGIDSSIVLPIVVAAMGAENVIAISNPTKDNGLTTRSNAQHTCDKLGVKLYWNSMEKPYNAFVESHIEAFEEKKGVDTNILPTPLARATMQAVGRTAQGLAACHQFGSAIVSTGNHTEIVLGWASFHDIGSIGVHSIIGDLTKVEVFQMAEFINEFYGDNIIPKNLYDGTMAPAAELADSKFDPFDYWIVSGICAEIIRDRRDIRDLILEFEQRKLNPDYFPLAPDGKQIYDRISQEDFNKTVEMCFNRAKNSVFKSAQSSPIVIISPTSRGFSNRETIINKYKGTYQFVENKMISLDIRKLKAILPS